MKLRFDYGQGALACCLGPAWLVNHGWPTHIQLGPILVVNNRAESALPHHHTESFENDWRLIRETPSSQKFRVTTPSGIAVEVDVHYTAEKILTANIVVEGQAGKGLLTPLMDDLGRLGLKRGDYALIDYTICETAQLSEGNFSISEEDKKHRRL